MEAVPRLPMISFGLKVCPDRPPTEFSKLKQYIRDFYHEDPETFSTEIRNLETLRANAVHPVKDATGCAVLKKYFCQLHFLQSRFPMVKDGAAAVTFSWKDAFDNVVVSLADIRLESVCVLYNIGALHSELGAADDRTTPEGLKMACSHFQCAAWAFQHLKDSCPQPPGLDLATGLLQFMYMLCLAQAQECILEKSRTDNRKATINAKVSAQIVDYYNLALHALVHDSSVESSVSDAVGSKTFKSWKRYMTFKTVYYQSIALLYQGMNAEEQQKMGERVAYFQGALDKLSDAIKLSKGMDLKPEIVAEALQFTWDVVEGKRKAAKNENEFIYHEEIPHLDTLPPIKGASLVKGIPFSVNDIEVSGPDIFARLVPMKAHEASSLYSEEKAKLLRQISAKIDAKDEDIVGFMQCLRLEHAFVHLDPEAPPQELVDRCAAMSAKPDAIPNLIAAMDKLNDAYHDVDAMLKEIMEYIQIEATAEEEYQKIMGPRPNSIVATDLTREANKYMEAHKKAAVSNDTLNQAMAQHIENLRVLQQPISEIQNQLPSVASLNLKDDPNLKTVVMLAGKVDEMRKQRAMLVSQLRESICSDDITTQLVTRANEKLEDIFEQEMQKHHRYVTLIEQNLEAQENIKEAFYEAYANYAPALKATSDIVRQREMMLTALISSYDAYEDLIAKSGKGLEFYRKLETNLTKLLQKVKGTCKVQQEERDAILTQHGKKYSSPAPANAPSNPSGGLKLKDYLQNKRDGAKTSIGGGSAYPSQGANVPDGQAWLPDARPAPVGSEGNAPVSSAPSNSMDYSSKAYNSQANMYQSYNSQTATAYGAYQYDPRAYQASQYYSQGAMSGLYSPLANVSYPSVSDQQVGNQPSTAGSNPYELQQYQNPSSSYYSGTYATSGASQQYQLSASQAYPSSVPTTSPSHTVSEQNSPSINQGYIPPASSQNPTSQNYTASNQYTQPSSYPQATNSDNYYQSASNQAAQYSQPANTNQYSHQTPVNQLPSQIPQYQTSGQPSGSQYTQNLPADQSAVPQYMPSATQNVTPGHTNASSYHQPTSQIPNAQTGVSQQYSQPAQTPPVQPNTPQQYIQNPTVQTDYMKSNQYSSLQTGAQYAHSNTTSTVQYPQSSVSANSQYPASVPSASVPQQPQPSQTPQPYSQVSGSNSNIPNYAYNQTTVPSQNQSAQNYSYATSSATPYTQSAQYTQNSYSAYPSSQYTPATSDPASIAASWQQYYSMYGTTGQQIPGYPSQTDQKSDAAQQSAYAQNYYSQYGYNYTNTTPHPHFPETQSNDTSRYTHAGGQSNVSETNSSQIANGSSQTYAAQYVANTSSSSHPNYFTQAYGTYPYAAQDSQGLGQSYLSPEGVQSNSLTYMQASKPNMKMTFSQDQTTEPSSTATPSKANTSSSNVDLLAGLDFNVSEAPLKPQQKSDPQVSQAQEQMSTLKLNNVSEPPAPKPDPEASQPQVDGIVAPVVKSESPSPNKLPVKDPFSEPDVLNQFTQEVEKFEKFVEGLTAKTLNGPTPLDLKWNELLDLQEKDSHKQSISVARCYPMKNRFPDILPFDSSRVELPNTKDDYINASYVKDLGINCPSYIMTQAPLPSTFADFWEMVLEQNIELIACLLSDSQMNNEIYWATSKTEDLVLGKIKVTLQTCNARSHWVERIMAVTDGKKSRVVVHLQFLSWPQSWLPESPSPFLSFVNEILSVWSQQRGQGSVVVHCDAGIGRSGVFVLTTLLLCDLKLNPHLPDIILRCGDIARQRKNPLRDRQHLQFAYQILLYYAQDLLMKRGILASRSTFEEKRTKTKSHTRHPSEDFLLNTYKEERRTSDASSTGSGSVKQIEPDPLAQLDPLWPIKRFS